MSKKHVARVVGLPLRQPSQYWALADKLVESTFEVNTSVNTGITAHGTSSTSRMVGGDDPYAGPIAGVTIAFLPSWRIVCAALPEKDKPRNVTICRILLAWELRCELRHK